MKRILVLLTVLVLCLSVLSVGALADGTSSYVVDTAGILSENELATLEQLASDASAQNGCGIYILAVPDFTSYGYSRIESFAEDLYRSSNLGLGEEHDGILLCLSVNTRDYDLAAYGQFGNYAFTDYGKSQLEDEFCRYFARNDWYGGFFAFLTRGGQYMAQARSGSPVDTIVYDDYYDDVRSEPASPLFCIFIGFIPALIIALIVTSVFKAGMKTARAAVEANRYVVADRVNLTVQDDVLIDTARTVTLITSQSNRGSSGGHSGGTSVNSSGFSHSSGKF